MGRSWLSGLIIIGLVAILLGGYYWYTQQSVTVKPAETYVDPGFAADNAVPTNTVQDVPESESSDTLANPPLSSDSSITEIETDLEQTIILEEDFSDL